VERERYRRTVRDNYGTYAGNGGQTSAIRGNPPTIVPTGVRRLGRRLLNRSCGSGLGANLSLEKGIINPHEYSTELKIVRQLSDNDDDKDGWCSSRKPPSISIRLDTDRQWNTIDSDSSEGGAGRSVTIVGRTTIHPRVDIVAKSMTRLDHGDTIYHSFTTRIPPRVVKGWKEGVWIPLISMTPGGKIISKNAFGFRGIQSSSSSIGADG